MPNGEHRSGGSPYGREANGPGFKRRCKIGCPLHPAVCSKMLLAPTVITFQLLWAKGRRRLEKYIYIQK